MTYKELANLINLMTDEEKNKTVLIRSDSLKEIEEILLLSKQYTSVGLVSVTLVSEPFNFDR